MANVSEIDEKFDVRQLSCLGYRSEMFKSIDEGPFILTCVSALQGGCLQPYTQDSERRAAPASLLNSLLRRSLFEFTNILFNLQPFVDLRLETGHEWALESTLLSMHAVCYLS